MKVTLEGFDYERTGDTEGNGTHIVGKVRLNVDGTVYTTSTNVALYPPKGKATKSTGKKATKSTDKRAAVLQMLADLLGDSDE